MIKGRVRRLFKTLHLSIALVFGVIFVLLGLTGTVIAWLPELDRALNPELLVASQPESGDESTLPFRVTPQRVQQIIDTLSQQPSYGKPSQLTLPETADDVYVVSYKIPTEKGTSDLFRSDVTRQVMIDPKTDEIKGERLWGQAGLSKTQLMPTIFYLHRYLLLGITGKTISGITACAFLIMAITGLILWFPRAEFSALCAAFRIHYAGSMARLQVSAHRVLGFFAAPVLIVLAFSGLYFNQPDWTLPVVKRVMTVSKNDKVTNYPVSKEAAMLTVAEAMQYAQDRYPTARLSRIVLPKKSSDPYEIRARQPTEIQENDGATRIKIDAYSGQILQVRDPLRGTSGDVFLSWMFPLHSGEAFGLLGRVFISLFGLMPLFFAVTGWLMWHRKRKPSRSL
ncbi:PepSY-associated TM helix domain-containing protein [Aquirhabdus parva]|uniref:PepSY domain-containing protein n=1 Tax=Aquirhabdus parva TaxID=2283318 RepID=A0A345PA24_9GAMM|nr:PepSY-associated TM helix domain-containing protein [Aquirhabdus parva]AXI04133.1 PepSY domain-containing protein [Aquirhabdus parva]